MRTAEDAVDTLAKTLVVAAGRLRCALRSPMAGPAERRDHLRAFDRPGHRRAAGVASALTVANVVRLAAHARRDEIEIMQLVGAPLTYVRGPLVLEGVMQGGAGASWPSSALGVLFAAGRGRSMAPRSAEAVGLGAITFLPVELSVDPAVRRDAAWDRLGGLIVARVPVDAAVDRDRPNWSPLTQSTARRLVSIHPKI